MKQSAFFLVLTSLCYASSQSMGTIVDPRCINEIMLEHFSGVWFVDQQELERGHLSYECSTRIDVKDINPEFKKSFASDCKTFISDAIQCSEISLSEKMKSNLLLKSSSINEAGDTVHDHGITFYILTNKENPMTLRYFH